MRPGAIGPTQAAAMLDCPEPFLSGLVSRGLLRRRPDGLYDAAAVDGARRRNPALRLLGTPLCDRELHGLNAGLRIPAGSSGGLVIGGARYMRLWEVLDAYWRPGRMA